MRVYKTKQNMDNSCRYIITNIFKGDKKISLPLIKAAEELGSVEIEMLNRGLEYLYWL